jgi:alpha,alpha-trehalase
MIGLPMRKFRFFLPLVLGGLLLTQCREAQQTEIAAESFYQTELFKDVQMRGIFEDSKTFVDLRRDLSFQDLERLYLEARDKSGFDLQAFVEEHFKDASRKPSGFKTDTTRNMYEHISGMWEILRRGPDSINAFSSRIPLPEEYIVPGGRFKEIYYWDSYFTMIGLVSDNRMDLAKAMLANFGHLIDSLGFIPNGTRDYYLTRSQPPFFSSMVNLLAQEDSTIMDQYFPQIEKEYAYWMEGAADLELSEGAMRAIRIGEKSFMNRYWDSSERPRPESYREDVLLAENIPTEEGKAKLYANLRAAAASGWDFSSRWYAREGEFASTQTNELIPVDLNSLMYFTERLMSDHYTKKGNTEASLQMRERANLRWEMINKMLWNRTEGFYVDYNFVSNDRCRELTLAGVFPLYFNIANPEQARAVKDKIMTDFLKPGGLVSTLRFTGQQWDAPNGWAPLQWVAVKGLLNYGYTEEAREIMQRWLTLNERVYKETGKMMEKYNVQDITLPSGGGEYPTQDGFGWSNGVVLGFRDLLKATE